MTFWGVGQLAGDFFIYYVLCYYFVLLFGPNENKNNLCSFCIRSKNVIFILFQIK